MGSRLESIYVARRVETDNGAYDLCAPLLENDQMAEPTRSSSVFVKAGGH